MKKYLVLCFSFVLFFGFAQVDTAQVVVPGRSNSAEAMKKPYVILISADGFRYDYAKKYGAKNLLALAHAGVQAKAMVPSYPSVTGPNHYTLVTGMYPSHTGFVDNYFYDTKRQDDFSMSRAGKTTDSSWLKGLPLWGLAENHHTMAASLFWVASNGTAGGTRPSYYYPYHEKFDAKQRISIVENWLKLPEEKRPHLITMYFYEVDKMGHLHGPKSSETKEAVLMVDQAVGELQEKVKKLGLPNVNFIFVSDHGMLGVDLENPLSIPEVLNDSDRFRFVNAQTLLRVQVKDPKEILSTYKGLKRSRTKDYKVYLATRFPKRLHYRSGPDTFTSRMGEIYLVPRKGKVFLSKNDYKTPGKHGYDPKKVPEMKSVFYATGPEFKQGKTIGEFKNVEVYGIVAELLDLPYNHSIDGTKKTAKKVLVSEEK
ncbi:alkaline phosphatase family protein [Chryseobacterium sp. A321]